MSPAAVCPRITLSIEVSALLYDALQITAAMSATTVPAFIGTALRQTQIAFFAEITESPPDSDVAVLDVRATPPSKKRNSIETTGFSQQRRSEALGPVQQKILDLLDAPTMCGVFDLFEVRQTMLQSHSGPAVSRAVRTLVRRGVLEPMAPTAAGFQRDVGHEGPVRFVRCARGS